MQESTMQNSVAEEVDYGVVVESSPDGTAQVMVPRREGCRTDAWRKNICDQLDQDNVILRTLNPVKASKGRMVEVSFTTPHLGKSMFVIYILPILALVLGAAIGSAWNPFGGQDISAVVGAVVLTGACLGLIFGLSRRQWGRKGLNMPTITNILD
jgi:positive regulator of sigma E activity